MNVARPVGSPPRLLATIWILLIVNVLGFLPGNVQVIPMPKAAGQVITMGALVVAFFLALVLNRPIRLRPGAYLVLISGLALVSTASGLALESGIGSLFRSFRFAVFVATLWLIARWWRPDLGLIRMHVRTLCAPIAVVVLGIIVVPGAAFSGPGGRLVGALWPIPAPQVGQYAAVATGLSLLLLVAGRFRLRDAMFVVVPAVTVLLLSHTRTALAGLLVALAVALLSLVSTASRARKALLGAAVVGAVAYGAFASAILTWLQRGQDADQLTSLTGRQNVWQALLEAPRTWREHLLGVGLTDKSFGGLAIDSSWLSIYHELGVVGVVTVIAMLVVLAGTAVLRPAGPPRACALFLVVYCSVASYTEVGLGDASAYLLHLFVAAAMLAAPQTGRPGAPTAGYPAADVPTVAFPAVGSPIPGVRRILR